MHSSLKGCTAPVFSFPLVCSTLSCSGALGGKQKPAEFPFSLVSIYHVCGISGLSVRLVYSDIISDFQVPTDPVFPSPDPEDCVIF